MRRSVWLSLSIVIGLTIWMLSGQLNANGDAEVIDDKQVGDGAVQPMSVYIAESQASQVVREVVVQGHIEPYRSATIKAETSGRIDLFEAKKGDKLAQGASILTIAMNDRQAALRDAKAAVKRYRVEVKAGKRLQKRGLQSTTQLQQQESALESALANLERVQLDIKNTHINAPFAGVLNQRLVEVGEYIQAGDPVVQLVDNSRLLVKANVPQSQVSSVKLGMNAKVHMMDGSIAEGRIDFMSVQADEGTRSFAIEAALENKDHRYRSGTSVELRLPVETLNGHFVSVASLSLGEDGQQLIVKVVDQQNRVQALPVSIIKAQNEGVWLSGLPVKARIITLGQGFVAAGDIVNPVTKQPAEGA